MSEVRDLYDINSNKTDKTYIKGEIIPSEYYFMIVMTVIRNSKGEFLIQKEWKLKMRLVSGWWSSKIWRNSNGRNYYWNKRSIGFDFSNEKFVEFDSGCDGYECYKMYFVNKDVNLEQVKIQEEELSEVRWFSIDELQYMVDIGELNENQNSCF